MDLSENDILFLPPAISQLANLTSLNLGKNSECREGGRKGGRGEERRRKRVREEKEEEREGREGRREEREREWREEGSKFLLTVEQKEAIYMSRM